MIRLRDILTEATYVSERTIPLDDVTKVGFPAIFMKFNNPYYTAASMDFYRANDGVDPEVVVLNKLNGKFRDMFGVNILGVNIKGYKDFKKNGFRYTLRLSGGTNNYYYEYWNAESINAWDDSRPFDVGAAEDNRPIVPTHWQLHLEGKTSSGLPSEIFIKALSSQDVRVGHYTQVIRGYDRDYEYEKHADGNGVTNYYARKRDGNLIRLKPGSDAYQAVKTKIFKDK